jgi:hypothetical protein
MVRRLGLWIADDTVCFYHLLDDCSCVAGTDKTSLLMTCRTPSAHEITTLCICSFTRYVLNHTTNSRKTAQIHTYGARAADGESKTPKKNLSSYAL